MADKKKLNILYTNIGRGHPFYLDGICEEINRNHSDKIDINIINVFDLSSGLSLRLWKLIRFLYKRGSQGGLFGKIYSAIRKNKKTDSFGFIEKILACGIRDYLKKNRYHTLLAHPMLIPMISDLVEVYYQHGELAVPDIAVVGGAQKIFVPTDNAKNRFYQKGVSENNIIVSGLCIEHKLKENAGITYEKRFARLNANTDLIGAFYSSGAEPIGHINKIIKILLSLEKNKQKGIVFCKSGGRLEKTVRNNIKAEIINPENIQNNILTYFNKCGILIVLYEGREEENRYTEILFKYYDYFVSPSHERTNWALGLGIPMFILHPLIDPFSPINRDILIENDVAYEILDDKTADGFAERLEHLIKNRDIVGLAKNGYGKFPLDGFNKICNSLKGLLLNVR